MDQATMAALRDKLEAERASIEHQLAEYGADQAATGIDVSVDEGFADSAQATAERSEMLSMIEQLHATQEAITAALVRMDDSTYGTCERCGQDIAPERLEALPTATLCVACKQLAGR